MVIEALVASGLTNHEVGQVVHTRTGQASKFQEKKIANPKILEWGNNNTFSRGVVVISVFTHRVT